MTLDHPTLSQADADDAALWEAAASAVLDGRPDAKVALRTVPGLTREAWVKAYASVLRERCRTVPAKANASVLPPPASDPPARSPPQDMHEGPAVVDPRPEPNTRRRAIILATLREANGEWVDCNRVDDALVAQGVSPPRTSGSAASRVWHDLMWLKDQGWVQKRGKRGDMRFRYTPSKELHEQMKEVPEQK